METVQHRVMKKVCEKKGKNEAAESYFLRINLCNFTRSIVIEYRSPNRLTVM